MAWYAVKRRYVSEETAYVEAPNAAQAKARVDDGDFYESDDLRITRYFASGPAQKVNGVPRSMWEAAGCPDDLPIRTD